MLALDNFKNLTKDEKTNIIQEIERGSELMRKDLEIAKLQLRIIELEERVEELLSNIQDIQNANN